MSVESQQIELYLKKILTSSEFVRSERMARFLRFVVGQSVVSAGVGIKERTIGIEVFDRPPDWDPKTDTIVRSEARRLRAKLENYYQTTGSADSLRIQIPKGGYSPEFQIVESLPFELPDPQAAFPPPTAKTRWPKALLPATAGVLACVTIAYLLLRNSGTAPEAVREVPFSTAYGAEFSPAISPDGRFIAYVWDGDANNFDIYVKPVEGGVTERFTTNPASDLHPAWSPDGKSLAFIRWENERSNIIVKPLHGGAERLIGHVRSELGIWTHSGSPLLGDPGPVWTHDGKCLIVSDTVTAEESHLVEINIDSGQIRQLTPAARLTLDFYPRLSPDGSKLAFARYSSHEIAEVFVMPLDTLRSQQLTRDERTISGLSWTPDGESIVFSSNRQGAFQLWEMSRSGGRPKLLPTGASAVTDPAVAASGNWLSYVAITENWNIWRARMDGSTLRTPERFIASSGRNHTPRYSPDGRHIVFVSDRSGSWEIWQCDAAGANLKQLTYFRGPFLGGMTWSPDSKRIAFDSRPSGHAAIFLLMVGGGKPQLVEQNAFEERIPSWSRDGKSLYFSSDRDGDVAIWKRSLTDGSLRKVTPDGSLFSTESVDGRSVYYNFADGQILRARADGVGPRSILPEAVSSPNVNWAVGKSGLYYTRPDARAGFDFFFYPPNNSPKLIGRTDSPLVINTPSLSVSPDERWILFAQQDHSISDIYTRRGAIE